MYTNNLTRNCQCTTKKYLINQARTYFLEPKVFLPVFFHLIWSISNVLIFNGLSSVFHYYLQKATLNILSIHFRRSYLLYIEKLVQQLHHLLEFLKYRQQSNRYHANSNKHFLTC